MNDFQKILARYGVYLEELRSKLVFLTKFFVVAFLLGFFLTPLALRLVMQNVRIDNVTIVTNSPFQLVEFAMSVSFLFACLVTIPLLIFNLYLFLRPGLLAREKNMFLFSLPLGLFLFLFGFSYGALMLYYGIKVISEINTSIGIANFWDISRFVSEIMMTSSLLGVLFIFPLIITFFIRLGALDVDFLRSKRRHAVLISFVLVSLLPPTDGLSLILMVAPLVLLFELTILFNRKTKQGRNLIT